MDVFIAIIQFLIITLTVASLLIAWFNSGLPVHIYFILHRLGFNMGIDDSVWDSMKEEETTRFDWETMLASSRYYLLSELFTCSICFSFHLSFLTALFYYIVLDFSPWFIVIATLTVPYISNILLKKFNN